MTRIKLMAVGKIKEKWVKDGIDEFSKRLKNKIETIEIKDSTKEKESQEIIKKLEKISGFIMVALDEHGELMNSLQFADFLKKNNDICFIIGGPGGLHDTVLQKMNKKISLSRLTFTHELALLIFFEQLYRGFSILEGKKYHRE